MKDNNFLQSQHSVNNLQPIPFSKSLLFHPCLPTHTIELLQMLPIVIQSRTYIANYHDRNSSRYDEVKNPTSCRPHNLNSYHPHNQTILEVADNREWKYFPQLWQSRTQLTITTNSSRYDEAKYPTSDRPCNLTTGVYLVIPTLYTLHVSLWDPLHLAHFAGLLAHVLQPERESHHSPVLWVAHLYVCTTTYLPRYLLPASIPNDKT